jgi:hypothetical protein
MLWQVPTLSLTGQAILFTIALGADSSRVARIVASVLAIVMTVLSMHLMSRHRQAEHTDAHWIESHEIERLDSRGTDVRGPYNATGCPVAAFWHYDAATPVTTHS